MLSEQELPQKILGRTGISVDIVGLGTAFLGLPDPTKAKLFYENPESDAVVDHDLGVQTVLAAIENNCNLIDTAPMYGKTASERMIREALEHRPNLAKNIMVTTKVGYYPEGFDYSSSMTKRGVEDSLKRLGKDRLEIVYIHDPMNVDMDFVMSQEGAFGALTDLQREGVVKFIGVAADNPVINVKYIGTGKFDAAVVPGAYSLLNPRRIYDLGIIAAARKFNVGLVIATPLERGLLVDGHRPDVTYLERSFSNEAIEQTSKIHQLCSRFKIPREAAALQWCPRLEEVTTTIPGAATPEQAAANMRAGKVAISDEFWQELEPIIKPLDYKKDLGIYSI